MIYLELGFILSSFYSGCFCRMNISIPVRTQTYLCFLILQLNLTGHCNGLSAEEIKDLWVQADIDGNGVLDYKEFQVILLKMKVCLSCLVLEPSGYYDFQIVFW